MAAPLDSQPTTLTWIERYNEMYHDMGLPIWQVAKRLGVTLESLYRMLQREHLPVPHELMNFLRENP